MPCVFSAATNQCTFHFRERAVIFHPTCLWVWKAFLATHFSALTHLLHFQIVKRVLLFDSAKMMCFFTNFSGRAGLESHGWKAASRWSRTASREQKHRNPRIQTTSPDLSAFLQNALSDRKDSFLNLLNERLISKNAYPQRTMHALLRVCIFRYEHVFSKLNSRPYGWGETGNQSSLYTII